MTDEERAVRNFVQALGHGTAALSARDDLFGRLGIEGDDAFEFMDRFAARFEIDASKYLWYFHHAEEGANLGGIFHKPPYRRVARIPVTLDLLAEAVRAKRWPIDYPAHRLPEFRWDLTVNLALVGASILGLCVWAWLRVFA
jgi:Protein of unknown function (DUF1493)